jgi:hypothetical protein
MVNVVMVLLGVLLPLLHLTFTKGPWTRRNVLRLGILHSHEEPTRKHGEGSVRSAYMCGMVSRVCSQTSSPLPVLSSKQGCR